jgi:hypothetical protein
MKAAVRTKRPRSSAPAGPRTSDEAVRQATGRERGEWFATLDAWGGISHKHGEIVQFLMAEHGVDGWWSQTITVDYERARGLRPPGGNLDGTFTVNASKTVGVAVTRLFEAFVSTELRRRWLPRVALRERTTKPARSARFDWQHNGTRVVVGFSSKGRGRSEVAVAHERLPNARSAQKMKALWRERLSALKTLLEAERRATL